MSQIKLKIKVNEIERSNGIGPITAKFTGGLPSPVLSNAAEFQLLMNKKGNSRILMTEDKEAEILFYDSKNIGNKNKYNINKTNILPQNKLCNILIN